MKSKIITTLLGIFISFIIIFGFGFSIGSIGIVPDYAKVYVDENTNICYSPLSLTQEKVDKLNLKFTSLRNAKILGYKIDESDRNNGYFEEEGRSVSGKILERLGILPKLKPRCNLDGSWNY